MSELITNRHQQNVRWHLLASVSALAIATGLATAPAARADDQNHFSVELSGQYGLEAGGSTQWFDPGLVGGGGEGGLLSNVPADAFMIRPSHIWNFDGAIKMQPADTDLILRLGIQYGRAGKQARSFHYSYDTGFYTGTYSANLRHREDHFIIDFQVGKDFGLGMFGHDGKSVFSAGIRYAHFTARTDVDFHTSTKYFSGNGREVVSRGFHGVGPMISWEASAPIDDANGLSLDWGANVAVLFGRQTNKIRAFYSGSSTGYGGTGHRGKTVPEVGGFAALSWHCPDMNSAVSLGYKVDAWFNVLDGGFANHLDASRVMHGPFLKLAIGTN